MVRASLERLAGLFRWGSAGADEQEGDEDGTDGDDEEQSQFLPSRLDASVLESHGMETTAAERELSQIQEKANQLEESERNR